VKESTTIEKKKEDVFEMVKEYHQFDTNFPERGLKDLTTKKSKKEKAITSPNSNSPIHSSSPSHSQPLSPSLPQSFSPTQSQSSHSSNSSSSIHSPQHQPQDSQWFVKCKSFLSPNSTYFGFFLFFFFFGVFSG
jgi:hypothetical protein